MISNPEQYEKAQSEIRLLEERLQRLQQEHPIGSKGFTKAGLIHEPPAALLFPHGTASRRFREATQTGEVSLRDYLFLRSANTCTLAAKWFTSNWRSNFAKLS
jgi:hypothetical protein